MPPNSRAKLLRAARALHAPAPDTDQDAFFEFLLRMGDTTLILGHRDSEWCGHAPALEEDIALANVALDLIGQTQMWLALAAEVEGKGRTADDLAYLRDAWDFRNLLLVERPNGDFGHTLMRQFLFDVFHLELLEGADQIVRCSRRRDRREGEQGSRLSRRAARPIWWCAWATARTRAIAACRRRCDALWPYTGEMFIADEKDEAIAEAGIAPNPESLRPAWEGTVRHVLAEATLTVAGWQVRAQGRQARRPHRTSRLHPGRDAVPAARLSRRELVKDGHANEHATQHR